MKTATEIEVLTGDAVGAAIRALFTPATRDRRRVILVAFVGDDPMSLLDDVQGAEIICWPKGDSTRAEGVRKLLKANATVRFADRLHMKVYWVEGARAVVGSANLSKNGLQDGLAEAAISVPATAVDIRALLERLAPRDATKRELNALARANRRADEARRRRTFEEWRALGANPGFKLGWYCRSPQDHAPSVKRAAAAQGGEASDSLSSREQDVYRAGDWILYLRTDDEAGRRPNVKAPVSWMRVHDVVPLSQPEAAEWDDEKFPHVAYQLEGESRVPPFKLDTATRQAIRKAYAKLAKSWSADAFPDEATLKAPPLSFFDDVSRRLKASR